MIEARDYRTGNPVGLTLRDGAIAEARSIGSASIDLPWIGPGLVDLQVNGYGGYDFGDPSRAGEAAHAVVRAMWAHGVTTFYPTVVTNAAEAIEGSMRAIAGAVAQDPVTARGICGIHLEGPFISPEDGARGAHSARYVRQPDWDLFSRWQSAAAGLIRLVTLSPEWPEAVGFIRKCVGSGVRVAIGHTKANTAQIAEAADAGASLTTHFGNGCHPMLPRHPNYLWDQLAEDRLRASLIADGFHLPASVVISVMKVKRSRAFLVSDVVSLSGLERGEYGEPGHRVRLTAEGRLCMADTPNLLAGSVKTLEQGVEQLLRWSLADLKTAWEMGSMRPAQYARRRASQRITEGVPADFVLFEFDGAGIRIHRTYMAGEVVFEV